MHTEKEVGCTQQSWMFKNHSMAIKIQIQADKWIAVLSVPGDGPLTLIHHHTSASRGTMLHVPSFIGNCTNVPCILGDSQVTRMQLDGFPQSEHMYVTSIQIKKQ